MEKGLQLTIVCILLVVSIMAINFKKSYRYAYYQMAVARAEGDYETFSDYVAVEDICRENVKQVIGLLSQSRMYQLSQFNQDELIEQGVPYCVSGVKKAFQKKTKTKINRANLLIQAYKLNPQDNKKLKEEKIGKDKVRLYTCPADDKDCLTVMKFEKRKNWMITELFDLEKIMQIGANGLTKKSQSYKY